MISYTNRNVYFLSIVITICIFTLFLVLQNPIISFCKQNHPLEKIRTSQNQKEKIAGKPEVEGEKSTRKQEEELPDFTEKMDLESVMKMAKQSTNMWELYIPAISLVAPIEEGTTKETMDRSIGHFSQTSILNGNVCLAAHNRGYPVNYFEKVKTLKKGDIIVYKSVDEIRKYEVEIVTVIKDTDWTNLQDTQENRITLITCVENEPEYRRCIQGIEIP